MHTLLDDDFMPQTRGRRHSTWRPGLVLDNTTCRQLVGRRRRHHNHASACGEQLSEFFSRRVEKSRTSSCLAVCQMPAATVCARLCSLPAELKLYIIGWLVAGFRSRAVLVQYEYTVGVLGHRSLCRGVDAWCWRGHPWRAQSRTA